MNEPIIVVGADKKGCRALGDLLEEQNYRVITCHSLDNLQSYVQENSCRVVIVDLDTVPVDNRSLRDLKRTCPELRVLAVSDRRFHPELREAMASHIYACLLKPVDPDELVYWAKSVFCDLSVAADRLVQEDCKQPR